MSSIKTAPKLVSVLTESYFNAVGRGVSFMPLPHGSRVLNVLSSIPIEKGGRGTFWFKSFTFQFSSINKCQQCTHSK